MELGVDWRADPNVERINHYHLLDRRHIEPLSAISILMARPASLFNWESTKSQLTVEGLNWKISGPETPTAGP